MSIELGNGKRPVVPRGLPVGMVEVPRTHEEDLIRGEVRSNGGVVIGKKELIDLGVIDANTDVPQIPEEFSLKFLMSEHPLRGGQISAHVMLGYDPYTQRWYCFDKSVAPGSLNLSGDDQDKLLLNSDGTRLTVEGLVAASPTDSLLFRRILDSVIAKRIQDRDSKDPPFLNVAGRTADTVNASKGCRVLVGFYWDEMTVTGNYFPANKASEDVGLVVEWIKEADLKPTE